MKEEVEKIQGASSAWRPPADEEPATSKAAVKGFIMSAVKDNNKPPAKPTIANVEANTAIPNEVVIPPRKKTITLARILKEAKNKK